MDKVSKLIVAIIKEDVDAFGNLVEDIEPLINEIEDVDKIISTLESEFAITTPIEIQNLKEKLNTLEEQIATRDIEVSEIQQTNSKVISELEEKILSLKKFLGEAEKKISNYELSINSLDAETDKLKAEYTKAEQLQIDLIEKEELLLNLREDISNKEILLAKLQSENDDLSATIQATSEEITTSNDTIKELKGKIETSITEIEELKDQVVTLQNLLESKTKEFSLKEEEYTSKLNVLLETNDSKTDNLSVTYETKIEELQEEITRYTGEITNLKSTQLSLLSKLEETPVVDIAKITNEKDIVISSLQKEISALKIKGNTGISHTAEYVKALEQTNKENSAKISGLTSEIKYPLITEDFGKPRSNLIVLKEIKTAIYLNSLIEYLAIVFKVHLSQEGLNKIVIILDPLVDEHRLVKYKSIGLVQNELALSDRVLLTNGNREFLKSKINLSHYDVVVVIDRRNTTQTVVRNEAKDIYYLIDSVKDIVDFNLDNMKCILFGKKNTITQYNIDNDLDNITYKNIDRTSLMADCEFVKRMILNES